MTFASKGGGGASLILRGSTKHAGRPIAAGHAADCEAPIPSLVRVTLAHYHLHNIYIYIYIKKKKYIYIYELTPNKRSFRGHGGLKI
jgi:hypothetical protein